VAEVTVQFLQGAKVDYLYLLQRMMMDNPEAAVSLAKQVARQPGPPLDLNVMADLFLQRNMVREATAFLLDVLGDNSPQYAALQTKVRAFRGSMGIG
jgi:clathrin heavy chain